MVNEKYNNTIFLTFDIDWACDEVIAETIELLEQEKISATIFVTNDSPILKRMRCNEVIELGIHPNFNNLFDGINKEKGTEKIVKELKEIVPEAKSIRSHSLVQSSKLLDVFVKNGFTHETNQFIPDYSGINILPYRHLNGIIRAPYKWEDSVHFEAVEKGFQKDWDIKRCLSKDGLKIFNFHPIHIFLNTEKVERYENSRDAHKDVIQLEKHKNKKNIGTRDILIELINEGKKRNLNFSRISEIEV